MTDSHQTGATQTIKRLGISADAGTVTRETTRASDLGGNMVRLFRFQEDADDRGAAVVEYALITALIGLALLASVVTLKEGVHTAFDGASAGLNWDDWGGEPAEPPP